MKILITGAGGFIGQYLTRALRNEGHEIVPMTRQDGDITDAAIWDRYQGIEHVFHLAAQTFVPASFENTYQYFDTNFMGTVNALEFCRKNPCKITFMSTYVYGRPEYLPIDEKHARVGLTPYHQSKICGEEICEFYSRTFKVPVAVMRPFNIYGAGQNPDFLIPLIFAQTYDSSLERITVMDLQPKRDYVYIADLIKALLLTLKQQVNNYEVYNVGSGTSFSVEEVIRLVQQVSGIYKPYTSTRQTREGEVNDCYADISALRTLGYCPSYSLADGLREMAKTYVPGDATI